MTEQEKPEIDSQQEASKKTSKEAPDDKQVNNEQSTQETVTETPDSLSDESELSAEQAEIIKLKDAFLRAKAEEDNVRRRSAKEVANARKFAVEGFAKEMLAVYDSLKLAVGVELTEEASEAIKSVHEGVDITLKQLMAAFNKFSLVEINPQSGDKLDPNLHQAMSMVESDDVASGAIISVIQTGFELNERLLRPALVIVAK